MEIETKKHHVKKSRITSPGGDALLIAKKQTEIRAMITDTVTAYLHRKWNIIELCMMIIATRICVYGLTSAIFASAPGLVETVPSLVFRVTRELHTRIKRKAIIINRAISGWKNRTLILGCEITSCTNKSTSSSNAYRVDGISVELGPFVMKMDKK